MQFCSNCGKAIKDSSEKYCSNCGHQILQENVEDLQIPEEKNPETTKKEMIASLKQCEVTVNEVFSRISEINTLQNECTYWSELRSSVVSKKGLAFFGLSLAWIFVFPVLLSYTSGSLLDTSFGMIIIICILFLPAFTAYFCYNKLNKNVRKIEENQFQEKSNEIKRKIKKLSEEIEIILITDEGKYAKSYIPQDYFYPDAVSMFIFYVQNGQADSIKEALREYDQYMHRCKMEYEANRMANASERTASASERTARASEQAANAAERIANASESTVRSIRAVEQWSASTNFWTVYNTLNNTHK